MLPCPRKNRIAPTPEWFQTNSMERKTDRIRQACDYIRSHPHERLPLARLAESAGLSQFHFQRSFKSVVGLTPSQFAEACRLKEFKGQLRAQPSVTDAIYEAGFGSGSRVYERVNSRIGMTPAAYRSGGDGVTISYVSVQSPLGRMMIGATDRGLCFVQFADSDEDLLQMLRAEYPAAELKPMRRPYSKEFESWMTSLQNHLQGKEPDLNLPLDLRATAFQMKVWRYLQSIPAGNVQSYSQVAAGIGQPTAIRAVARACATNPVVLVIPCHRVIRSSGDLGGYRSGAERKRKLLEHEGVVAEQ
jgi:AraC family transcriptional regulator, regulatory protein of adaptative response / methylated-DNA-[protein]-cysteine methyltransferase